MKKQILGLALGAVSSAVLLVACGNEGEGSALAGSTYTASTDGVHGTLTANITINEGQIVGVSFDHADTADIVNPILDNISETLISSQNANSITADTIAGATPTGKAAMDAITAALNEAGFANAGSGSAALNGGGSYASGSLVSAGNLSASLSQAITVPGVHGDMEVTAFIEDGELVGLAVDHVDTADIVNPILESLLHEILATRNFSSVDVDVIAGATPTAEAVINAMALLTQLVEVDLG